MKQGTRSWKKQQTPSLHFTANQWQKWRCKHQCHRRVHKRRTIFCTCRRDQPCFHLLSASLAVPLRGTLPKRAINMQSCLVQVCRGTAALVATGTGLLQTPNPVEQYAAETRIICSYNALIQNPEAMLYSQCCFTPGSVTQGRCIDPTLAGQIRMFVNTFVICAL